MESGPVRKDLLREGDKVRQTFLKCVKLSNLSRKAKIFFLIFNFSKSFEFIFFYSGLVDLRPCQYLDIESINSLKFCCNIRNSIDLLIRFYCVSYGEINKVFQEKKVCLRLSNVVNVVFVSFYKCYVCF